MAPGKASPDGSAARPRRHGGVVLAAVAAVVIAALWFRAAADHRRDARILPRPVPAATLPPWAARLPGPSAELESGLPGDRPTLKPASPRPSPSPARTPRSQIAPPSPSRPVAIRPPLTPAPRPPRPSEPPSGADRGRGSESPVGGQGRSGSADGGQGGSGQGASGAAAGGADPPAEPAPRLSPPAAAAPTPAPSPDAAAERPQAPAALTPPVPVRLDPPKHPDAWQVVVEAPGLAAEARSEALTARVRLRVWVLEDGTVERAQVAVPSGRPQLDSAAVEAARGWRFLPARRNGAPIASVVLIWVAFVIGP